MPKPKFPFKMRRRIKRKLGPFKDVRRFRKTASYSKGKAYTGLKSLIHNHMRINCVYKTSGKITLAAGTQYSYSYPFRTNSCWDPDYQNLGKDKTCQGWAILQNLFNTYQVDWCKVYITFQNLGAYPMNCVLSTSNDNSNYGIDKYASDIASRAGSKSRMISAAGGSGDKVTMSYFCVPWKQLGLTKALYGQSEYAAPMNNSPSANTFIWATIGAADDSLLAADGNVVVSLSFIYHVRLFDIVEYTDAA